MRYGFPNFPVRRRVACGLSTAQMVVRHQQCFCIADVSLPTHFDSQDSLATPSSLITVTSRIADASPRPDADLYWLRKKRNREAAPLPNESGDGWAHARAFASPHKV